MNGKKIGGDLWRGQNRCGEITCTMDVPRYFARGVVVVNDVYRSCETRDYGVDLMKIIAMFFIVLHHIIFWGGYGMGRGIGYKGFAYEFIDSILMCHVNCFVLASGWVMSRKSFKIGRVIKLWLEAFMYSALFLCIALLFSNKIHFTCKDVIINLLPLAMDRYWFFTQYVALFFLMPILNCGIEKLSFLHAIILYSALFVGFTIFPMVLCNDVFRLHNGYSVLWFSYLYLLGGGARKWQQRIKGFNVCELTIIVILCVGGSIIGTRLYPCLRPNIAQEGIARMFRAYNSPLLTIQSLAVLLLFSRVHITSEVAKRLVMMLCPSLFSVYLIHSNQLFRSFCKWNEYWSYVLDHYTLTQSIFIVLAGSSIVYFLCIVFDIIVRRTILVSVFAKLKKSSKDSLGDGK